MIDDSELEKRLLGLEALIRDLSRDSGISDCGIIDTLTRRNMK